jgi:hypothetical protein
VICATPKSLEKHTILWIWGENPAQEWNLCFAGLETREKLERPLAVTAGATAGWHGPERL